MTEKWGPNVTVTVGFRPHLAPREPRRQPAPLWRRAARASVEPDR